MPDFDKMFDRLSGESEQRKRERADREAREQAERDDKFERDRNALLGKVEGVLAEAKQQFERKGVPIQIENNWSGIGRGMFPEMSFKCSDEYRPNSIGGKYKPEGRTAFFSVRDGKFEAGLSGYAGQRVRSEVLKGEDSEVIDRAIEEALGSYLQSIEDGERPR